MAIEGIGSGMLEQPMPTAASTTMSSPKQSMEASARISEVEPVEHNASDLFKKANAEYEEKFEERQISNQELKKRISELNKQLNATECQYGIHEETQRVTIKIVDKETKEVLKEFPPEKTLEMIAKVWEMAGILVDEKR